MEDVVVVIGVRGFGLPIARRLGKGRHLLLGDINAQVLEATAGALRREGYKVSARVLDLSDAPSVRTFAEDVPQLGRLRSLVLTAGLSPRMASADRILEVNLLGPINLLDAFLPLVERGTVGVLMASTAAYYAPVPPEIEKLMALGDRADLMHKLRTVEGADTGLGAYWLAKRCNQLRVEAAAPAWGAKGGRIVSVSPGIISTEMIHFEREVGAPVDETVAGTPVGRIGNPDEIAAAVEWLSSPDAAFVTGADLLIDGGLVAALRWGALQSEDPQDVSRQAV